MAGNYGLSGSSVCVSALGDPCLGAPSGKFSDRECGSLPAQGGTETMKRAGGQAPEAGGGASSRPFFPWLAPITVKSGHSSGKQTADTSQLPRSSKGTALFENTLIPKMEYRTSLKTTTEQAGGEALGCNCGWESSRTAGCVENAASYLQSL